MVPPFDPAQRVAPSPDDTSARRPLALLALRPLPARATRLVFALGAACVAALLLQHVAGIQSGRATTALSVETPDLATQEPWPSQHLDLEAGEKAGGLFKDSLRADRQYLTGFAAAGFTNQVLGAMNLLHIAFLISRLETSSPPLVVVLPPVTPHYDHLEATEDDDNIDPLPLSAVFDLPAFEQATGLAVVDWHHIKDVTRPKPAVESLACWSATWFQFKQAPSWRPIDEWLGIQRILTPLPPSLLSPTDRQPPHFLLPAVAGLLSPPDNRARHDFLSGQSREAVHLMDRWEMPDVDWRTVWGSRIAGWREPDSGTNKTIACIDGSYFGSERGEEVREMYLGQQPFVAAPFGPWSSIGRHLRWHAGLLAEAEATLRLTLGLTHDDPVPSSLATMHIRRGDLIQSCKPKGACGAVAVYAKRLAALQHDLILNGFSDARNWPVVVTTDEKDPEYLLDIEAQGWILVDHAALRTRERVGHWGPTLLDVAILSLGTLFVGTDESTMSILTLRRVQDWQGGIGGLVSKWEKL